MDRAKKRASSRASKELKKSRSSLSSLKGFAGSSDDTRPDDDHLHKTGHGTINNGETGTTGESELDSRWGDKACGAMEGPTVVGGETSEEVCKKADDNQEDMVGQDVLTERNRPPREFGRQKTLIREGKPKKSRSTKQPQDQQTKLYTCACGKNYATMSNLNRHQKTHGEQPKRSSGHRDGEPEGVKATSETSFPCICGKNYTISSHLYRHQKTCQAKSMANLKSDAEEGPLKPYTCACGKSYTCSSHLYRHQRTHTDGGKESANAYICDCGKLCSSESNLYRHRKMHTQEALKTEQHGADSVEGTKTPTPGKPYMCLCGKSYTCSSHLYRHQKTHQADNVSTSFRPSSRAEKNKMEKPYKCECGKSYTCTSHLYRHQRSHKNQEIDDLDCHSDVPMEDFDEKPHQCECGKSFILWFSLMVHKRIHCKAKLQASSAQNGH
ncbi:zinc finger protein 883-like [Eleutherodactylus coqui]|uniref:zinc finger protein 883-like n=1 Tax=Eleutherodactylus coqui TaxID=57060 RepID=UPI0034632D83